MALYPLSVILIEGHDEVQLKNANLRRTGRSSVAKYRDVRKRPNVSSAFFIVLCLVL